MAGSITPNIRLAWALLLILASALPLMAAVGLMQLLDPLLQPPPVPPSGTLSPPGPSLPGAINFAAVTTLHLFACIAAIGFAGLLLRNCRRGLLFASVAILIGAIILSLMARPDEAVVAYRLSYRAIVDLFESAGGARFTAISGAPPFAVAVFLPTVFGVFAVVLIAAATTAELWRVQDEAELAADEAQLERLLCLAHDRVKRCAYCLSFVLVTSTVGASLFFRLPVAYLAAAGLGAAEIKRLDAFATEMTFFWGMVYTLTLLAAVAVPLLLVQKRVLAFLDALEPPERAVDARRRLTDVGVLSSGREYGKMLLTLIAPLVSGPIASFLQAAAG